MFLIPVRLYITQCIKNLNQQFYSVAQAQGIFASIIDVLLVTVIIIMSYCKNSVMELTLLMTLYRLRLNQFVFELSELLMLNLKSKLF